MEDIKTNFSELELTQDECNSGGYEKNNVSRTGDRRFFRFKKEAPIIARADKNLVVFKIEGVDADNLGEYVFFLRVGNPHGNQKINNIAYQNNMTLTSICSELGWKGFGEKDCYFVCKVVSKRTDGYSDPIIYYEVETNNVVDFSEQREFMKTVDNSTGIDTPLDTSNENTNY